MAEEEPIIDFGFSAVTADEYEKDQTDGENTGSGGSASPEALASMDSKIEQIMAHLASKSDEKDEGWSTSDAAQSLEDKLNQISSKVDEVLVLERDEERAQTTADILSQLNDATEATSATSKKSGEVVGKQDEIMKFLQDMSPKIDKILKLESLEALLESSATKSDEALSKISSVSVDPPDLSPILEKIEAMEPKIEKILKMEQLEAVQSLQQSSSDMSAIVKEIEERKKDLNKTFKARMLAVEKLILPLIANLQKDVLIFFQND
jgi:vacuolar-type H+-ATPase subunit I/STV1